MPGGPSPRLLPRALRKGAALGEGVALVHCVAIRVIPVNLGRTIPVAYAAAMTVKPDPCNAAAPHPGPIALRAWRTFLTAHARVTEILERELESEAGMQLSWYDVLVQLSEAEENRLRMHELAHLVLLSRAGLTRLVDRMTTAGLVERAPCPEDRRGLFVHMTLAGREALEAAAPVHMRGIELHFARHIPEAEQQRLMVSLGVVVAAAMVEGGRSLNGRTASTRAAAGPAS